MDFDAVIQEALRLRALGLEWPRVAVALNDLGLRTQRGLEWTAERASWAVYKHGPAGSDTRRARVVRIGARACRRDGCCNVWDVRTSADANRNYCCAECQGLVTHERDRRRSCASKQRKRAERRAASR